MPDMSVVIDPAYLAALSAAGLAGGIALFGRGLVAYRKAAGVSSIATSPIEGLAAGEVRVVGTVEPGISTLVSPLQSAPCVYYHARVTRQEGRTSETLLNDERGVSFRVRDATGVILVLPRGAHWELPTRFSADTGITGDAPAGLQLNQGPTVVLAAQEREAQIADLLTVHQPGEGWAASSPSVGGMPFFGERVHYGETRLEIGDSVTVIGPAVPFGMVWVDVEGAPIAAEDPVDDPAIAADLADAAASGRLSATAEQAWGNAAIPGFGVGQPTRPPELDPGATPEAATPAKQETDTRHGPAASAYDVGNDQLVLAVAPGQGMTVYAGAPAEAAGRQEWVFWTGLAGAVLAVASALVFVISLGIR